jgi:hypothetical protein
LVTAATSPAEFAPIQVPPATKSVGANMVRFVSRDSVGAAEGRDKNSSRLAATHSGQRADCETPTITVHIRRAYRFAWVKAMRECNPTRASRSPEMKKA